MPTVEIPPQAQRLPNRQVPLPLSPARLPLLGETQRSTLVALMAQVLLEAAGWAGKEQADESAW
jgi:hypothetical protein